MYIWSRVLDSPIIYVRLNAYCNQLYSALHAIYTWTPIALYPKYLAKLDPPGSGDYANV